MRKAFVIGLGQFSDPRIPTLPAAEKDAAAVLAILTDPAVGSVDREQAQILRSPTRGALRNGLAAFIAGMKEGDDFILFVAGHGHLQASGRLLLPCRDSRADQMSLSAFSELDLRLMLDERPGLRGILILDVCHAGSFGQVKSRLKAREEQSSPLAPPEHSALAIVQASRSRELTYESVDSGLFTSLLIQGLRAGAGCPQTQQHVSPADIVDWIRARMRHTKIDEQFWPGLREGKAVAGLALARNPSFLSHAQIADAAEAKVERTLAGIVNRLSGSEDGEAKLLALAELVSRNETLPAEDPAEVIWSTKKKGVFSSLGMVAFLALIALLIFAQDPKAAALKLVLALLLPAIATLVWYASKSSFLLFSLDGFVMGTGERHNRKFDVRLWRDVKAVRIVRKISVGNSSSELVIEADDAIENPSLSIDGLRYSGETEELQETFQRWRYMRESILPAPRVALAAEPVADKTLERLAKVAVLVGAWDYSHLPSLSAPKYDMERLRAVLSRCGMKVLEQANPDLASFESWLGDIVYAASGEILLLVFSGHGLLAGDELMLAFPGTRPDRLAETAFPVAKLVDLASDARLRHFVIVLDCCMSGAGGQSLGLAKANLSDLFEADRASITVLAAAAKNQKAYAPQGAPSFFTSAVADAIEAFIEQKQPMRLIGISDAAAQRLEETGLGQKHWRFASDAATGIVLSPLLERKDIVSEKHDAVASTELNALRRMWNYAEEMEFDDNYNYTTIVCGEKACGDVFFMDSWRMYRVPRGAAGTLMLMGLGVAFIFLALQSALGVVLSLVALCGFALTLRGSLQPRSRLLVSVAGIAKDGQMIPSVSIANTVVAVSKSRIQGGEETVAKEWQIYGHDGRKTVLVKSGEPWGGAMEKMQASAEMYLAEGRIAALKEILGLSFQRRKSPES